MTLCLRLISNYITNFLPAARQNWYCTLTFAAEIIRCARALIAVSSRSIYIYSRYIVLNCFLAGCLDGYCIILLYGTTDYESRGCRVLLSFIRFNTFALDVWLRYSLPRVSCVGHSSWARDPWNLYFWLSLYSNACWRLHDRYNF